MKQVLNILLATFFTFSLKAGETTKSFTDHTFTIHIGAFVKAKISDFKNIQQFGYLYSLHLNNLQQVYMGDYETEAAANKVLAKVKNVGYPDAFTTRRSIKNGNTVTVIQLGTLSVKDEIDWSKYAEAGPLSVLLAGNSVKIVTGNFDDLSAAKQRLNIMKKLGFNDAFMKNINELLLHKVTSFETGGQVDIPQEFSFTPEPEAIVSTDEVFKVDETAVKKSPAPSEAMPESYDVVFMPKSPPPENEIAEPTIRKNVKRTSVLKLQEVLKAEGTYSNSLDGFYGPGTAKGYNITMSSNPEIQKYQVLAKFGQPKKVAVKEQEVQQNSPNTSNPLNWESIVLLKTIVNDLNPSPEKPDAVKIAEKLLKQAQLLSSIKAPNTTEYVYIDAWNESLWNGMDAWEKADPLHKRLVTPLKITYFKSWALLEDYFMNKGFKPKEARGVSLFVLQNIVEPGLSIYIKK
jgi:hypothetical protein